MSIQLSVLGSGSGGNATVLMLEEETERHCVLIDVGFSPKDLCARLAHIGIKPEQIGALWITHLHGDHFHEGWLEQCQERQIPIFLHRQHVGLWRALSRSLDGVEIIDTSFSWGNHTDVQTLSLPHDQQGSVGYLIEHRGVRLGFATDLGHVPVSMLRQFQRLDILAIESNYDPILQQNSPRPAQLKRRIMGRTGHLSNQQAHKAICHIDEQSSLRYIFLLHRSEQCNDISLIQQLYAEQHPHLLGKMVFTEQHTPTALLRVDAHQHSACIQPCQQMDLFSF